MPAFKRRSRQERRNRAYKSLLRKVARASGFPTRSRNQRRWLRSFLPKLQRMSLIATAYTDQLKAGLDSIRDFGIVDFDIKTVPFMGDHHHEPCLQNPETQRSEDIRHDS